MSEYYITNKGYCHCCRNQTTFESKNVWLRDYYYCLKCYSIPRQRHIQYVLDNHFKGWGKIKIHESSPSNNHISQYCDFYSSSQYLNGVDCGATVNGVRCENLERLTFADNTFDIFITQDVFEHVFNPSIAVQEIIRVLRPGGVHIFTAPKHRDVDKSYPRALIEGGQVKCLFEPQYHGNPVGDGRSLVTWDYGADFECLLSGWANCPVNTFVTRDISLGLDGEYLEVFVMHKPQVSEFSSVT